MASTVVRVFGNPITDGTRSERALAAKNGGKLDQAQQGLEEVTASYKERPAIVCTTFGQLYNATGEPVTFEASYNWEGKIREPYPVTIENGQWATFLHVGTHGPEPEGSVAGLAYKVAGWFDSLIMWSNPWKISQGNDNTVYCRMENPELLSNRASDAIHEKLVASDDTQDQSSVGGYTTKVTIDAGGNTPTFTAYFSLDI